MFAVHEVTIAAGYGDAAARLAHLVTAGSLRGASETAYEGGLAELRVGPLGGIPGLSKLVHVRFLEPGYGDAMMTVRMRWEAAGPAGELFPVLDADLVLAGAGPGRSRLSLMGAYRPPLGRAGAALDRAVMHRVATATVRSLVRGLAETLVLPAPRPHPGAVPALRPAPDPGTG